MPTKLPLRTEPDCVGVAHCLHVAMPCCRPRSLLVLGRPGTGKTTLLRDLAKLLSDPPARGGLGLAVVIVDTSNEIAGADDGDAGCVDVC